MELDGKRILVTGAARGMGEATVHAYVAAGTEVIGLDVNDGGRDVAKWASEHGPGDAAFAETVEYLGGLDVLAHPAAIQRPADTSDVTVDVRDTMLTN